MTIALMQDSGANAISAAAVFANAAAPAQELIEYLAIGNTVSSTTFKVYVASGTGTVYWNAVAGGTTQVFTTTTSNSFISIDEIMG